MQSALKNLSKNQLIDLLQAEQKTVQNYEKRLAQKEHTERWLNEQIAQLKRMLYGQKRERFQGDASQACLPFEAAPEQIQVQQQELTEKITYVRNKQSRPNHKGRVPLPDHLPVQEIEIYPEGDLSGMVCIGTEVTEELELEPARFYIKRYIRYKYAPLGKNQDGVQIGELPERVIDKGIPGPGLLATILVDKYMPITCLCTGNASGSREKTSRLPARPSRDGPARRWSGWPSSTSTWSPIPKPKGTCKPTKRRSRYWNRAKKGSCHQGYYWVYHNPINKSVLFDYQPTRGEPGPKRILDGFKGYLQTDGYGVIPKDWCSQGGCNAPGVLGSCPAGV
jgi:transposase